MALWSNITRLGFSGPVQGVKNPGSLEVITPAQTVQVVDDASWAVAPVAVPQGLVQALTPGFAGVFSGLEIQAGGQGIWLKSGFVETPGFARSMAIWEDNAQATVLRVPLVPFSTGVGPGVGPETVFSAVTVPAIPTAATGRVDFGVEAGQVIPLDMFIPAGSRVFLSNILVNSSDLMAYTWREVPSRNRADEP